MGQLSAAEVRILDDSSGSLREAYERARVATGQRLGAIKQVALDGNPGIAMALDALAGGTKREVEKGALAGVEG